MRSFPNEVLYAPIKTYAGLGCKRFSSTVNKRKKAVFHRNSLRKGPHSIAANSLAHRAHRKASIPTAHLQNTPPLNLTFAPRSALTGSSWFRSVLEEAHEANRSLCIPGSNDYTIASKPIMAYDSFRTCGQEQIQWWHDHGLLTISDFREFDSTNQLWQWSDFSSLGPTSISAAQLEETLGNPPQDDTILRVGQFWMSNGAGTLGRNQPPDGSTGTIFEIVGFQQQLNSPSLIAVRLWHPSAPSHPGTWMHLRTSVYSHRKEENMLCSSSLSLHHLDDLFGDVTGAIGLGPTTIMNLHTPSKNQ